MKKCLMNNRFLNVLLAGSLLPLVSCQSGANVVSQSVNVHAGSKTEIRTVLSDYLPGFKAGQKWVYSSQVEGGSEEVSYEIISVSANEVVQKVSVRSASGQQIGEELISLNRFGVPLNNSTHLSQSLAFGGGFAGPKTQVNQSVNVEGSATNVEVHQSATSGGTTVSQDIAPLRFEAAGQENVKVQAGSYKADVFHARSTETFPRTYYTLWLVKDLGEVKSTQQLQLSATSNGSTGMRELKSFQSTQAAAANLAVK